MALEKAWCTYFFFNDTATTEIYTLSLHDALPILARRYKESGMSAYSQLQETEFSQEREYGYEAVKHQGFVGTGYFDFVTQVIAGGVASTTALAGSTEAEQFAGKPETALGEADRAILIECPSPLAEAILGRIT